MSSFQRATGRGFFLLIPTLFLKPVFLDSSSYTENSHNTNFQAQCHVGLRLKYDLNIAKMRRCCMETRKLCPPEPFPLLITAKGSCWHRSIEDMKILDSKPERQRFYGCSRSCKITKLCRENHCSVTGRQSGFFLDKCL